HNRSALFWSATFGSMTITKVLLDYEADMNLLTKKSRSTVLMGATSTGRLDIVQLLVSRGASWKVVNEDGLTALDVAKQEKYEHLIQYFSSLDDSESQMRKALTTDIKIKLKITRMSIHGAPGSGKTCLQHLILNEPPPLERSSTDVVTPAVRGSICGYMETDSSHSMKRVSEEEFITHLAKRLKGKEGLPSSKQHSSTYPPSTPPPPTPPSRLSSLQRAFTSLFSRTSSESSDASSPLPDSPLPTHSVHYDIISQVSTESCSEEDYRAHWTFCIDSGALSQEEERDYRKVIDPIALAWGNGSQPVPYGLFTGLRRNAIGLEYNKKGWLVLLDRICFIEAFFTGPPNLCHEILSLVSTGLEKAAESCRYRQESLGDLKTGFYSGGCDHIHFTRDGFIYCRSNYEKLSSRQSYWFDNNSLDSSVIIAGQKLFILQGDRSHSLQWEKYGFRLECPRGAVSKDTEVAVTALAGGNFKVPKGTVLVSAVYAISVSKALLKPLVIELQHCVDLRNTCQTGCLKFVRAPLKSPYQFSIVEGGSFRVGKRYGSIKREQFCCMGIVAEMSNGDTPSDSESEEGYETPPEGSTDDTHNDSGNGAGETSERTASPINTGLSEESVTDDSNQKVQKVESTSGASDVSNESTEDEVKQKPNEDKGVTLLYTGMMYYEKKEVNQWMSIFSVVQDLDVLWSYLENEHPEAEKDGPIVSEFKYNEPDGILQLCLQDAPSLESGWTVHPNQSPMQIRQCVVDKFIDDPTCKRSSIHISVYAKPGIAKDPLSLSH
uniref:Uncharacterized protein n=1 Tax=Amphimedon queenslandica TaxID=400682 RepID=A0A1X7TJX5_AMPQE